MVVGTLSLVQKSQTSGCTGCSTQWMQYAVDAVCSGIMVYGGEDIVFGAKRSNQWMQYSVDVVCRYMMVGTLVQKGQTSGCSAQWMQHTVHAVEYGIWWWGHCLWCKRVIPVGALDEVCSGRSMQWTQYLHSGHSGCSGIVVYGTTIPLHPLCTAYCIYCVLCSLCPLCTVSTL